MGAVFVAYDPQLDRRVALKVLHRPPGSDRQQREWTLREARALARVAHPHVVSVYEVGEAAEQVYLAMEFVDGMTLRRWQGCDRRTWREVLRMYLQAGEGLLAAHRAGVVHRDFKPDNVLVGRNGLPKVADFGIARLRVSMDVRADGASPAVLREPDVAPPKRSPELHEGALWVSAAVLEDSRCAGTLGYMAPEQHSRSALSEASDQWSFCAALHEALYGRLPDVTLLPDDRPSATPVIAAQKKEPGPFRNGTPPEVQSILSRGLAQDPERRFNGMSELLIALWAQHDQSPGAAPRMSKAMVGALSVLAFLLWVIIQNIAATQARIARYGVAISCLMICATLCVGHIHRLSLRINPFHRWMWTLLLVNFVQVLCIRSVSAFLMPLPFHVTHILEMTVWFGTLTVMSTQLLRPLRWALLVPLCSAGICAFMDSPPRRMLLIIYPILVCWVLWTWRLAGLNKIPVVSDRWRGRS